MWPALAGACLALAPVGHAAPAIPLAEYRQQIGAAQGVVTACAAASAGCDSHRLPEEGPVAGGDGHPAFTADWEWLRTALDGAAKAKPQDRAKGMAAAMEHLRELGRETAVPPVSAEEQREAVRAERLATEVLAGPEFAGASQQPSWWDRLLGRVQDWLFRLLSGVGRVGRLNPWLAPAITWGGFTLAAAGLLLFVSRSLRRQSLRIRLDGPAAATERGERDAAEWARQAAERAAAGDWRAGVHCLYWAAIASLEARRAWRPNPTRTPREYLPLLRPGSEAQRALRELTRSLERLWYGQGAAAAADFAAAEAAYGRVLAADLRRGDTAEPVSALGQAAGAA